MRGTVVKRIRREQREAGLPTRGRSFRRAKRLHSRGFLSPVGEGKRKRPPMAPPPRRWGRMRGRLR